MQTSASAVLEECIRLRKVIQPISEKYHGLLDKSNSNNTKHPFVLLLGNHSSGKSSFVNYVLGRKIQSTGVAPTDDSFTIIGSGVEDVDKNGPALVGDPDLGFNGLQMFGPSLVNHTQLKIRTGISINDFMIVDSPGMIDSPGMQNSKNNAFDQSASVSQNKQAPSPVDDKTEVEKMDRGYNFEGVVRWYAERADVILLFFDPDKPGTTGETLQILTTSLVGLDHKLFIILSKADQFHRIHDFARAYGSLCWNLSKVIPRKDLPRIHTMCLPAAAIDKHATGSGAYYRHKANQIGSDSYNDLVVGLHAAESDQQQQYEETTSGPVPLELPAGRKKPPLHGNRSEQSTPPPASNKIAGGGAKPFLEQGRYDLEEARDEVIREVFNAPRRRIDNEISRLTDSISSLTIHCAIVDNITAVYHSKLFWSRLAVVGTGAASVGLVVGAGYLFDWLDSWPAAGAAKLQQQLTVGNESASAPSTGTAAAVTAASKMKPTVSPSLRGSVKPAVPPSPAVVSVVAADAVKDTAVVVMSPASTGHAVLDLFRLQTKASFYVVSSLVGAVSTVVVAVYTHLALQKDIVSLTSRNSYVETFANIYSQEIANNDQYTRSLGEKVVNHLEANFSVAKLLTAQRVKKEDKGSLQRILNEDVANLRRRASPSYPLLSPAPTPVRNNSYIWSSTKPSEKEPKEVPKRTNTASPGVAAAATAGDNEDTFDDEEDDIYTPTSIDLFGAQSQTSNSTEHFNASTDCVNSPMPVHARDVAAAVRGELQQGLLAPKDSFVVFDSFKKSTITTTKTSAPGTPVAAVTPAANAAVAVAMASITNSKHSVAAVDVDAQAAAGAIAQSGFESPVSGKKQFTVDATLSPLREEEAMASPKELKDAVDAGTSDTMEQS